MCEKCNVLFGVLPTPLTPYGEAINALREIANGYHTHGCGCDAKQNDPDCAVGIARAVLTNKIKGDA